MNFRTEVERGEFSQTALARTLHGSAVKKVTQLMHYKIRQVYFSKVDTSKQSFTIFLYCFCLWFDNFTDYVC